MGGQVAVAGVFPPGSVVSLVAVPDERVLRPEGHELVEQKLSDGDGNVSFAGLRVNDRFFVTGYVAGSYLAVRARAVDLEAPDSELAQAPVQPSPQKIGTQEDPDVPVPPAEPDVLLPIPVEPEPAPAGEIAVEHVIEPQQPTETVTMATAPETPVNETSPAPPQDEPPPPAEEPPAPVA